MYVCNQHTVSLFYVLQSPRGVVYSNYRHSICSRLKKCTQTAWVH